MYNNNNFIFLKSIKSDNAQGSCGILILPDKQENTCNYHCRELIKNLNTNCVFYKYGNTGYNCTLSRQEYVISKHLLETCSHLPNFLRPLLYIKNHLVNNKSSENPFEIIQEKKNISCVDIVLYEYLDCKQTLWDLFTENNYNPDKNIINSILVQIFLAIICSQQNAKFVHNDLHTNNILIMDCDPKLKILYRFKIQDKIYTLLIPTYGKIPIIIDYGFSYSDECIDMSLECCDVDNFGIITYKYDCISDFIRLLIAISKTNYNYKLCKKINELFKNLPISRRNSWEKITKKDSLYEIEKIFIKIFPNQNETFAKQNLRLILRKICLPLNYDEEYSCSIEQLEIYLELFFQSWSNIEKWFKYSYEKIFLLREFVDSARKYDKDLDKIAKTLHSNIYKISGVDNIPINVDYTKLVEQLNISCGIMKNILYKKTTDLNKKREKYLYSSLISGENMFLNIFPYIIDKNNLTESGDIILLIDNIDKKNTIFTIDENSNELNLNAKELFSKI